MVRSVVVVVVVAPVGACGQARRLVQALREQSGMSPPRQFAASSGNGPTSSSGVSLAIDPRREVAPRRLPFVMLFSQAQPTRRTTAAVLGKMPTTSVRRLTSLFNRSSGLFDQIWRQCAAGNVRYASTSASAEFNR